MAKIRTIKPEFWEDQKMGKLKRDCRLLFAGMFNFADDGGVIQSSPGFIKSRIFPHDEDLRVTEVKSWLNELEKARMLLPLTYNGESYYIIRTFNSHQVIDKRYARYSIPLHVVESAIVAEEQQHNVNTTGTHSEHAVGSPQEMEGKWKGNGNGGGEQENPPSQVRAYSLKSIDELMAECLKDQINFVEYVCRKQKISEHQLVTALQDFNERLKSGLETAKTAKDYRFHFQNWFAKQDKSLYRINPKNQQGAVTAQSVLQQLGL